MTMYAIHPAVVVVVIALCVLQVVQCWQGNGAASTHRRVATVLASIASSTATPHHLDTIPKRVLVIGGTGRVGRQVVHKLLHEGIPTNVLLRHKDEATVQSLSPFANSDLLQVFEGTVHSMNALLEASKDCDAIIDVHGPRPPRLSKLRDLFVFNPKQHELKHPYHTNYLGTKNILASMHINHVTKIVRLTGSLVDRSAFNPIVLLFNALLSLTVKWHELSESAIRASHVDYTIIRCPEITNDPPLTSDSENQIDRQLVLRPIYASSGPAKVDDVIREASKVSNDDLKVINGKRTKPKRCIPSGDVADLCVSSLLQPQLKQITLFASSKEGSGSKSWQSFLTSYQPDLVMDSREIRPRKHVLALTTLYTMLVSSLAMLLTKGRILSMIGKVLTRRVFPFFAK